MSIRQNGLDILFNLEPSLRNKLINTTRDCTGFERAAIFRWIINGEREQVNEILRLWNEQGWGVKELQTFAWIAAHGLAGENVLFERTF